MRSVGNFNSKFTCALQDVIQRRAMRSFLHVARNMNPKEFRWNKDVILEAVSRSLVGCEDLWPVAVKLAIATVTRCEGSNPRSPW